MRDSMTDIIVAIISVVGLIIAAIVGQPIINNYINQSPSSPPSATSTSTLIPTSTATATATFTPTPIFTPSPTAEILTTQSNVEPEANVTQYVCTTPGTYRIKIEENLSSTNNTGSPMVLLIFPDENIWSVRYVIEPRQDASIVSQEYTDVFCQNSLLIVPMEIEGQEGNMQGQVNVSIQRK